MKTAVITGGSQGLGKVLAKKLVAQNFQVILIARRKKYLQQACQEIGPEASYYQCDISKRQKVNKVMSQIKTEHGQLNLLVNNAGVWVDDDLQLEKPAMMRQAVETNILGQIYVTEACLPLLTRDKVTRILTVISSAAVRGIPAGNNTDWKTYGASKWGLRGYTDALKKELRSTNIQVLQFFPAGFESNLYQNAGKDKAHDQPWMMKTESVAEIAVFAITRPDDVYLEQVVVSKFMN